MQDSSAEWHGFKSQPRRCRLTVLGKLFTPIARLWCPRKTKCRHDCLGGAARCSPAAARRHAASPRTRATSDNLLHSTIRVAASSPPPSAAARRQRLTVNILCTVLPHPSHHATAGQNDPSPRPRTIYVKKNVQIKKTLKT